MDDVGFIASMMDELIEEGLVDPTRVYVTGHSNGAVMSHRLACSLGRRIAAIAPVGGTMPRDLLERLEPCRAMPVLHFHGTRDKVVRINGALGCLKKELCLSAGEMAAWWARNNGCDEVPTVQAVADVEQDGTTARKVTYSFGPAGAPVVFYEISGGGHTWPGGRLQAVPLMGRTSKDVRGSEIIWGYFSQHSLPEIPSR
jgi:polyhydroxybutyrate depolymerase